MSRPVWPDNFDSLPLRTGYTESMGNSLRRTQPDAGPSKVRLKAGTVPDSFTAVFCFNDYAEYSAFSAWIKDKKSGLAGGVMCFDWTHPLSGETLTLRLVPESAEKLLTARPYEQSGSGWEIPATLEIMP